MGRDDHEHGDVDDAACGGVYKMTARKHENESGDGEIETEKIEVEVENGRIEIAGIGQERAENDVLSIATVFFPALYSKG